MNTYEVRKHVPAWENVLLDALIPKVIVGDGFGTRWDNVNIDLRGSAHFGDIHGVREEVTRLGFSRRDRIAIESITHLIRAYRFSEIGLESLQEGKVLQATSNMVGMIRSLLTSIAELPTLAQALHDYQDIITDQAEMRRLTGKASIGEIQTTELEVIGDTQYRRILLERNTEPYIVTLQGTEIIIHPHVWAPTTETELLTDHLPSDLKGTRILDLTTGSGAVATIAGLRGAHGVAIDINANAVANATGNFQKHGIENNMQAIESNLFANLGQGEFDLIVCNPPYYTETMGNEHLSLALGGGKTFVENLFRGLSDHLTPNGRMLITYAEWADIDEFLQLANKHGYNVKQLERRASRNGKRLYKLFEITVPRSDQTQ